MAVRDGALVGQAGSKTMTPVPVVGWGPRGSQPRLLRAARACEGAAGGRRQRRRDGFSDAVEPRLTWPGLLC